ncbi:MAG: metallophosphoesterase [Bdellovibrio sp.]|nr:metallophosphoesterase [Bdellovibrio sp.]
MNKIAFLLCSFWLASASHALDVAVFGDGGKKTESTLQILQSMLKYQVKDAVLLGDNLYDMSASYHEIWDDWMANGIRFPVVALGNHRLSYQHEREYFGMPDEYYAKIVGDVRFIVLNSDNHANVLAQRDFFLKEMGQKKNRQITFTFLVFHHPPATLSPRHQWIEKKLFHDTFRPLLLQYRGNIDGIFVSHDHAAGVYSFADIPLLVSGAAYEFFPLNPVNGDVFPGVAVKTLWIYQQKPHWARLETFPKSGEAYVHFIEAESKDSKVVCSVLLKMRQITLKPNCKQ